MDAFISYSHEDKDFVEQLERDLLQNHVEVWRDEPSIATGQSIIEKIGEAITKSKNFVIVLSPNAMKSKWVRKELETAITLQLSRKPIKVLPVLIKDCRIPSFLQGVKYADFRQDYSRGLGQLLTGISTDDIQIEPTASKISWQRFKNWLGEKWWEGIGALIGLIALIVAVIALINQLFPGSGKVPIPTTVGWQVTQQILSATTDAIHYPTATSTPTITPSPTIAGTPTLAVTPTLLPLPKLFGSETVNVVEGGLGGYSKQHAVVRDQKGTVYVFYDTDAAKKLWVINSNNEGKTWSKPTLIGTADEGQEYSAVADSANRIHLAWGGWKAGILYYSLFENGKWKEAEPLLQGSFARNIAIDSANNPHIVISSSDVWHIFIKDGKWTAESAVKAAWHPDVVVDANDNVHIAYNDGNFYATDWVRVRHASFDGRSWSKPDQLAKGPFWSGGAAMVVESDGTIHVAWLSPTTKGGGEDLIYYSRFIENEWQDPVLIGEIGASAGSTGKESPSISVDGNGLVYVFWRRVNDKGKSVITMKVLLPEGWSEPIDIGDSEASSVGWPSVSYNQGTHNEIDVVWSAVIGDKQVVRYKTLSIKLP